MGKLIPSSTNIVLREQSSWRDFRKALRKEDREVFDKLFSYAKFHSQAIGMSNKFYPLEAILMTMLIEIKKELDSLKDEKQRCISV